MNERRIGSVPRSLRILLPTLLAAQLIFSLLQPRPQARADQLSPPPPLALARVMSVGEPIAFAQMMTLYLQAFDNQPGISIPFAALDYNTVSAWLERILDLDPKGQYPLMMASQLYAEVPDENKQRRMFDLVYREFLRDPDRRWPWLAHVAIMAKHRLKDLPLALHYAQAISTYATGTHVPHWARQMQIFLHEDMGELETAKVLLGGLLDGGIVTDPHEIHFLIEQLNRLSTADKSSSPSGN
ncbi:MAG: hypothetical protein ABI612_10010 [Betaproteobacteria bacterium]